MALGGIEIPQALSYVGLPASASASSCVSFTRTPVYLLTIENFASFNRHILEVDAERRGLTIYTGGYPSHALQQLITNLSGLLPNEVPCFHWSDIDPDGVFIFLTVARALGRPLHPHLMSSELALRYGSPTPPDLMRRRGIVPASSPIAPLAAFLASSEARTMEQEGLDPKLPDISQSKRAADASYA